MRSVRLASVDFFVARYEAKKCGPVNTGDVYEPDTTPTL